MLHNWFFNLSKKLFLAAALLVATSAIADSAPESMILLKHDISGIESALKRQIKVTALGDEYVVNQLDSQKASFCFDEVAPLAAAVRVANKSAIQALVLDRPDMKQELDKIEHAAASATRKAELTEDAIFNKAKTLPATQRDLLDRLSKMSGVAAKLGTFCGTGSILRMPGDPIPTYEGLILELRKYLDETLKINLSKMKIADAERSSIDLLNDHYVQRNTKRTSVPGPAIATGSRKILPAEILDQEKLPHLTGKAGVAK